MTLRPIRNLGFAVLMLSALLAAACHKSVAANLADDHRGWLCLDRYVTVRLHIFQCR